MELVSSRVPEAAAARSVNIITASSEELRQLASVDGGEPERWHGHDVLTLDLQRFAGGRHHPHLGRMPQNLGYQVSGRLYQVLAVVEDEQELTVS